MRVRNYTVIFIFLFLGTSVFSQNQSEKDFNISWSDNVIFRLNSTESITTCLVDDNLLNENLLPEFSSKWKINSNIELANYYLKNIEYEVFTPTSNITSSVIESELDVKFNFSKQRDDSFAILYFVPIIKEGNSYKRVVSFDLVYSSKTKSRSKSFGASSVKNSVLSSGEWYKFAVDTTGVFKLDRSFLQSLGVSVSDINPKYIQIYGNGGAMLPYANSDARYDGLQENTIYIEGEDDESFDASDYILFYAKGPHSWESDSNSLSDYEHTFNIFSDEAYYFITIGSEEGKRIEVENEPEETSSAEITTYHDYTFFEEDEVNLYSVGQQWFGDSFNIVDVQSYTIPFANLNSSEEIIVRARGVVESSLASEMNVKVSGETLFTISYSAASGLNSAYTNEGSGTTTLSGESVSVDIEFVNNGNPSAEAYLDYIEVLGVKNLLANGQQFSFRNLDVANSSGTVEYSITNANQISTIWEVTDFFNPKIIENNSETGNYKFKATAGSLKEYIVLNENDFYEPINLETSNVENQNLHSLTNLDYIVITQDYLINQGQRLADYHEENSGLITEVIDLEQVYNEFSSGSPDITAIRDFIKHLYDNSTTNKIKYVCFLGDASYDYKDRVSGNNNIVPVFEAFNSFNLASSYVTDDYYAMMDDNEGELNSFEGIDVVTGRIPVTDVLDAETVIDKILDYYNEDSYGQWRTNITLVADDIDASGEEVLELNMESIADEITENKPIFNIKKVFIDAYEQESTAGGESYPTVNTEISNQIETGTLLIDYFGHGGSSGWASESILTVSDIQSWNNIEKLPLLVTVTCEFTKFDNPLKETAGEYVFWSDTGGAASLISTTREVYISVGRSFNEQLIEPLLELNNEDYSIAENLMNTKNSFTSSQRYFIYFIGDPAMKLAVPDPDVVITKMNDVDISQSLDTIKALATIKFEGEVQDGNNNRISDFNGEFSATVYDKQTVRTTLDNDNAGITMDFDVQESKIFNGRATIEDGYFSFEFVAPKDLKVAYGTGKLSLYAHNSSVDKAGYNLDIVVGGTNEDAEDDDVGPTIQLYMNDLNFVDGGNTNQSPLFLAVLEDENGINTSTTAVDHDIVAVLDGDTTNSYLLNDYYETELDDYTEGTVSYQLRDLETGYHTITLKAWDTYNNSSEATLTFFVVGDDGLELSNVLNYPNPFINYTEFWFNHNKPNELLEVQIQILTISGKIVKTINQTVQSDGNLSRTINWNGLDDFGSKIGKGTYIYKLKVKSLNSNTSAEKIEKLVILQ